MGEKPLEQLLFAMLHHHFAEQLQSDDKRLMFLLRHGQLPLAERQDGKYVVVILAIELQRGHLAVQRLDLYTIRVWHLSSPLGLGFCPYG
ncbi:hypothetical protein D3C79_776470 [compost metagenome]